MKKLTTESAARFSAEAKELPRLRTHELWHKDRSEQVQRFMIALQPGSYVRPHKHPSEVEWEALVAIQGRCKVFVFDDDGRLEDVSVLSPQGPEFIVELDVDRWHSLMPLDEDTVIFEFKPGPMPSAEFAEWAPPEGDESVKEFLNALQNAEVGDVLVH